MSNTSSGRIRRAAGVTVAVGALIVGASSATAKPGHARHSSARTTAVAQTAATNRRHLTSWRTNRMANPTASVDAVIAIAGQ